MAKTKTVYLANDNTEFDTEAAADAHNEFLEAEMTIEAYITAADLKLAQAGLMRRHISGFLAFQKREDLGELVAQAAVDVAARKEADKAEAAAKRAAAKTSAGEDAAQ